MGIGTVFIKTKTVDNLGLPIIFLDDVLASFKTFRNIIDN